MGLESATYLTDLVNTNPVSSDAKSQGDDHIRLIKAVLLSSFPGIAGVIGQNVIGRGCGYGIALFIA